MPLRIAICPYRLLFKRPFGTAHGLRDGTDALFIRVEHHGVHGYGEVTLPPYVKETIPGTVEHLRRVAAMGPWELEELLLALRNNGLLSEAPACRAGIHTALIDAQGKARQIPVIQLLEIKHIDSAQVVMTIGICDTQEALEQLEELPASGALKLKVGDAEGLVRVKAICERSDAAILLDGNQGMEGLAEATALARAVGHGRLLGFEQPFSTRRDSENLELARRTGATVFADESAQGLTDLERISTWFNGVNIKLMKCGGLDTAASIAKRARALGLKVMLGSMSETSLGCTAMAHLSGAADVVDLDGPWLIANDPFVGLAQEAGRLVLPKGNGLGAVPRFDLNYTGI